MRLFCLVGLIFTVSGSPVRCADKTGESSGTNQCSYALTNYCGLTDVCCPAGCAPIATSCAGNVGFCQYDQVARCDDSGCCCINRGESTCNDQSFLCSNSEPEVNRVAQIAGGIVGGLCLLCCCAGIFIAIRNSNKKRECHSHTQLDSGAYMPPQQQPQPYGQQPAMVYHVQPGDTYAMPVYPGQPQQQQPMYPPMYQQQQHGTNMQPPMQGYAYPVAIDGNLAAAPPHPQGTIPPGYVAN